MKKIIAFVICLLSWSLASAESGRLDVMPLQLQFRYEDSVEQTRQLQRYNGLFDTSVLELNLAFQYQEYRFSLGRSYQAETTGNSTLEIEKRKTEYLIGGGYRFWQFGATDKNMTIDLFANLFYGFTQSQVATKFFGNTTNSKSEPEQITGGGLAAVGHYKSFVAEVDFKYLYSVNSSPQYVPAMSIRFGACFYF